MARRGQAGRITLSMNPVIFSAAVFSVVAIGAAPAAPVVVTLNTTDGMKRGGTSYFVKGAGGDSQLPLLAGRGANSIRTWSTDGLGKTLDEAARAGLTVSAGIWLEPECSWFSYRNAEHCARQSTRVKEQVMLHRGHPALLAWGIGNEAEGDGGNEAFWQQLERLAIAVKEIDSAHPLFTALAGINAGKADGLNRLVPHLDFVRINTYGGLFGLRETLAKLKWTRPWMVTEWGPQGFWERPKGVGGMALEQTSTEKAEMMTKAYAATIAPGNGCLGSYAFVWGWKYEATSTWFGLLTHDGKTTAGVDALQQSWTGKTPANTAPSIKSISGVPNTPVAAGTTFNATTYAKDAEGDALTWSWTVLPEAGGHDAGATPPLPAAVPNTIGDSTQTQAKVKAPVKPGRYRLHVQISDSGGHAATANAPFVVQ